MTPLLELQGAHKRYAEQQLLDGASVVLTAGRKVGLVGRNGAGKSTLCRVLLGEEELDAGEVLRHPTLRLGYLRQHDPFQPGETVLDFLLRDTGQPDWKCGEVAARFALRGPLLESRVGELSGGWQTRVKLAALLLHDPNLLILDEPTNFLDLRTQLLLEEFLKEFKAACLVVSHDRGFLRATCTQTLELSRGRLTMFQGDVDAWLVQQAERRLHDERVNDAVRTKQRQLETFIRKNRANASTASQARSKAKQLARLQEKELERPEPLPRIVVPDVEPRRGPALRCRDLAIGYEAHRVAERIDLEVEHGARIAIVGDNGQGKTTLLRAVTGSLPPLDGTATWGYGCDVGTYAQHVYTSLPPDDTIEDYLHHQATAGTKTQTVLDVAGSFLFRGSMVEKRIAVLSGGERARLCLAGLLLGGHNVLVLDEPANHLDVETVDSLATALVGYRGTLVFTSHDRHFVERVATGVAEVADGRVASYPGSYASYLHRVEREAAEGTRAAGGTGTAAAPRGDAHVPPSGKGAGRQRHRRRREVANLERKIARLDEQKQQLERQLLSSTDPAEAERLHTEVTALKGDISSAEEAWFEMQEEGGEG